MNVRTMARKAMRYSLVLALALVLSGCGAKDLVSLAKLDKGDLKVSDRYGNQVKVANPADFLKAIKEAKKLTDASSLQWANPDQASHIISAGSGNVYYDWENKYLFHVDGSKKTVYSADLQQLLLGLSDLPPRITVGSGNDPKITGSFADLAKVTLPSAALFKSGDKALLMVAAGERATGGYTMELEKAQMNKDGSLGLTVRLRAPSGTPPAGVSYPYLEISVAKYMNVDVRIVTASSGGDVIERANTAVVPVDGNVILFKPDRGALLTERVRVYGFARLPEDQGLTILVEDGHYVLGSRDVPLSKRSPAWSYFDFEMDLKQATNPSGMVIAERRTVGKTVEELQVPVSFGGK
jgi:hypothetical protein